MNVDYQVSNYFSEYLFSFYLNSLYTEILNTILKIYYFVS